MYVDRLVFAWLNCRIRGHVFTYECGLNDRNAQPVALYTSPESRYFSIDDHIFSNISGMGYQREGGPMGIGVPRAPLVQFLWPQHKQWQSNQTKTSVCCQCPEQRGKATYFQPVKRMHWHLMFCHGQRWLPYDSFLPPSSYPMRVGDDYTPARLVCQALYITVKTMVCANRIIMLKTR